METLGAHSDDNYTDVSIPRGGPIYIPELISPFTGVLSFQDSVIQELQNLRAETQSDASQSCHEDFSSLVDLDDPSTDDDRVVIPWCIQGTNPSANDKRDLRVDDLKIFSEEELVNKALKVAFKGAMDFENSSPSSADLCDEETLNDVHFETTEEAPDPSTSISSLEGLPVRTDESGKPRTCLSKKRKKGLPIQNNLDVEKSCMSEVKKLVKIREKQDEDKAAARLHSFHGGRKSDQCVIPLPEKDENARFFKSTFSKTQVKSSNFQQELVSHPEIVLCVEIYNNNQMKGKSQELLVLGRQVLTELRDKIDCLTDEVMQKAGQYDPSGYFLIEEVFFNDLRDRAAIDYSKPIFEWLKTCEAEAVEKWQCILSGTFQERYKKMFGGVKSPKLPRFKAGLMEKTRFCDLRFQIGAGYLYCHQGGCRHKVVIKDMRLRHAEDVSRYPVVTYQQRLHFRKCSACRIYKASRVTVDDKLAPENPCYFCDQCYFLLHYSDDHSLLYTGFSVFDYIF